MKKDEGVKKGFIMPILAVSLICLFMSGALAIGDGVTRPIIEANARVRAYEAMHDIIPGAGSFSPIEVDDLPRTVSAVYGTNNDTGYIFLISVVGYGGDISIICGIGPDGRVIKTATLAETETKGIATPVFDMEPEYIGKDKSLAGIDVISGATITSVAYINGIKDAFEAFEIIMGAA